MLTLFIPQNCDEQICTITQNYENPDIYHKTTLYWNGLTMFFFMLTYFYELKRENWSIKYLDIAYNFPDTNLKSILVKEPKLDKQMDRLNLRYRNIVMITILLYFMTKDFWLEQLDPLTMHYGVEMGQVAQAFFCD